MKLFFVTNTLVTVFASLLVNRKPVNYELVNMKKPAEYSIDSAEASPAVKVVEAE